MANIANGEMGIRGAINNIQHFLNDIRGFDRLAFELKGMGLLSRGVVKWQIGNVE